jgi:hypothetical protein
MKRKNIFLVLLLFIALQNFGQDKYNRWALTFGVGGVLYSEQDEVYFGVLYSEKDDIDFIGRFVRQFPRLSASRYISKNLTLSGSISFAFKHTQRYTTYDSEIRYDFGTSQNTISPYILLGGSLVHAENILPTLNFGSGGTLWFSKEFGIHGQFMYKFNEERFTSQKSHFYGSLGIVYRFSSLGVSYSPKNSPIVPDLNRKRIWNNKQ